jgi:hypothetical protein
MPTAPDQIDLSLDELREIAGYAADCASRVLPLFERDEPDDPRPREAIESARAFAAGGKRTTALRVRAMDAYRAALQAGSPIAGDAAHAASQSAAAAFLHPLARATQVWHVLGSAAYAAHAAELDAGDDPAVGAANVEWARQQAPAGVIAVLRRLPAPPGGRARAGELLRDLDAALRRT